MKRSLTEHLSEPNLEKAMHKLHISAISIRLTDHDNPRLVGLGGDGSGSGDEGGGWLYFLFS